MNANGMGDLCYIDGTMDHKMYINILKKHLAKSVGDIDLTGDYIFTQDNDSTYKPCNTRCSCYTTHPNG